MKKIFSLVIALTLFFSLFAVTTVAFAEGEGEGEGETTPVEHEEVVVHNDKLLEIVGDNTYLSDSAEFAGWLTTATQVKEVFEHANFALLGDEGYNKDTKYDEVRLEYCTGNPRYADNWEGSAEKENSNTVLGADGASIELNTTGIVLFRYAITYKTSTAEDATEVTKTTDTFFVYVEDTTKPDAKLTSTLELKQTNGLTVGTAYTVSTSLTITDSSSTSTTYVIQKLIDGVWTEIYDSVSGEVAEGYKGEDVSSGVITPAETDASADPVYKVIYTVTDAEGFVSDDVVLSLHVNEKKVTTTDDNDVDVLKIVLYVIAGLSAAGIVVLLFVKPKNPEVATNVVTANSDNNDAE